MEVGVLTSVNDGPPGVVGEQLCWAHFGIYQVTQGCFPVKLPTSGCFFPRCGNGKTIMPSRGEEVCSSVSASQWRDCTLHLLQDPHEPASSLCSGPSAKKLWPPPPAVALRGSQERLGPPSSALPHLVPCLPGWVHSFRLRCLRSLPRFALLSKMSPRSQSTSMFLQSHSSLQR